MLNFLYICRLVQFTGITTLIIVFNESIILWNAVIHLVIYSDCLFYAFLFSFFSQ